MLTKDEIKSLIERASDLEMELVWLPKIMEGQTDDEIEARSTFSDNKIGLNNADASIVTAFFMRVKRGAHLTIGQAGLLRQVLPKYSRQFARMTNGNEKKV